MKQKENRQETKWLSEVNSIGSEVNEINITYARKSSSIVNSSGQREEENMITKFPVSGQQVA